MLAIITKMTLTQVSTWFANARRRLKKENKMTWSPKNKANDDRKDDFNKSEDCLTKGHLGLSFDLIIGKLKHLHYKVKYSCQMWTETVIKEGSRKKTVYLNVL